MNTTRCLLTAAALLTAPLGCDPDASDGPFDSDSRLAHELEEDEGVTVDYYGTPLAMEDMEDMEVHCLVVDAAGFRCFDTIEEADAVHLPTVDSLTARPDHQAVDQFCRFFEHSWYGGSSFRVDRGYGAPSLGGWNDRISSIECVAAKARVYENSSYGGDTKDSFTSSYVGNLWNDQISSVKSVSP